MAAALLLHKIRMSMKKYKYVIVGGGVAAGFAAEEFVNKKVEKGEVAIITEEGKYPYHRHPLSEVATGEKHLDDILVNDRDFYADNGIEVLLNSEVTGVDFQERTLELESGTFVQYDKLLIATGSRLPELEVPGADLPGLHYLRNAKQAQEIRQEIKKGKKAAVIGGNYIAMEVAASLAKENLEVTLVFPSRRLWESFFTPEMSNFFSNYLEEKGVEMLPQERVASFSGSKKITGIVLQSGKTVEADLIVCTTGAEPAVGPFLHTPLELKKGVLVNEFLEASEKDVYAAGDVTTFPNASGELQQSQHWDNARAQAKHVVQVMTGDRTPYSYMPYFFSEVFDLPFQVWGDTEEADEIVYRGEVEKGNFSTWWLSNGKLVAAFIMKRPEEEAEFARKWLKEGKELDGEKLEQAEKLKDLD